jgi:hypothetical protein
MFSQEYLGAIALLIVGILKAFGIEVANDAIAGILTGGIALFLAIKRHKRGDIGLSGIKRL